MQSAVVAEPEWRQEIKFILHRADVEAVGTILGANARPARYGKHAVSTVHSIYFDDERLSGCRESIAGVGHRFKLRLRWYDTALPHEKLFFEVKQRRNLLGRKLRQPVDPGAARLDLDYAQLLEHCRGVLDPRAAALLGGRDQPTVLIAYRRQHFIDGASGLRMTLDYEIAAYEQLGLRRPARRFAATLDDLVVVEVKGHPIEADRVRELLYPLTPRRARCSKYVSACARLGWVDAEDRVR